MKTIDSYIIEKLTLNKQSKLKYNYHPINFTELRSLIEKLLNDRGKDADLNDIDVSQVTTFYDKDKKIGLFEGLDPHNIDISKWDVSNVENMCVMFCECYNFNCNLSNWNVIEVRNMNKMFCECYNFNCNLSNWNVNNVRNMNKMFYKCYKLKQQPSWYWYKE